MTPDLLLYALIAAGLIFWLRSILGTRDEDEEDNNVIPRDFSDDKKDSFPTPLAKMRGDESNVVRLNAAVGQNYNLPRHIRIDNKTTENKLDDLIKNHPDFDLNHFLEGAQYAFPMIIEAFADGDKETLESVLAPNVYQAFSHAIDARLERGETVETTVKAIEKIDLIEAQIKDGVLLITLRFSAREICVIRNAQGDIISGDPERITEMVDIWVFGRELEADGPEWFLYETRDDAVEDHKTPIPESGKDKE